MLQIFIPFNVSHLQNKTLVSFFIAIRFLSAFQIGTGFLQELGAQPLDVAPRSLDVMYLGGSCADGKAQGEAVLQLARH